MKKYLFKNYNKQLNELQAVFQGFTELGKSAQTSSIEIQMVWGEGGANNNVDTVICLAVSARVELRILMAHILS